MRAAQNVNDLKNDFRLGGYDKNESQANIPSSRGPKETRESYVTK